MLSDDNDEDVVSDPKIDKQILNISQIANNCGVISV